MRDMLRTSLGTLAGLITAFALVAALESAGHLVFPPPEGLDPSDPEAVAAAMASMPVGALVMVVVAWIVAAFVGPLVGGLIARDRPWIAVGVVGTLLFAATVANLAMLPHPVWMAVTGLLGIALGTATAGRIASRRAAPAGATSEV